MACRPDHEALTSEDGHQVYSFVLHSTNTSRFLILANILWSAVLQQDFYIEPGHLAICLVCSDALGNVSSQHWPPSAYQSTACYKSGENLVSLVLFLEVLYIFLYGKSHFAMCHTMFCNQAYLIVNFCLFCFFAKPCSYSATHWYQSHSKWLFIM